MSRAKTLLEEHRDELETLAQALLEYETLSGDEIKTRARWRQDRPRHQPRKPTIPAAGSSIPKAKRPKPGIGGAAPQASLKPHYIVPIATDVARKRPAAMKANVTSAIVRTIALNRPSS